MSLSTIDIILFMKVLSMQLISNSFEFIKNFMSFEPIYSPAKNYFIKFSLD